MDLTSKRNIKNLLEKHQLKPLKRFGQNFLIDKRALRKIVAAADLNPQDTVLEIGPGIGTLTQELAEKTRKVIAIEKDRNMIDVLKETLKNFKNVEIIQNDILKIDPKRYKLKTNSYKLVGNLPFYLTAPVIRKFLEMKEVKPLSLTVMIQKEVGQRICAKPPRMNLLAVSVQFYAKPEIISYISKKSFWPQPKVNAAIVKIMPRPSSMGDNDSFFKIVKAGFSQPRKQLINNLSRLNFSSKNLSGQAKGLKIDKKKVKTWLLKNRVQSTQRAETLRIEDWIKLTKSYKIN